MPNRILKESICTSNNLDNLTLEEEIFFYRLMVNCDDYGRMDARPAILRARLFPLRTDSTTEDHITKWLYGLAKQELINVYEVNGQQYLQFKTWENHQKVRDHRAKYPEPPAEFGGAREHSLPDEKDVEDLIYYYLSESKFFNGEELISVDRQVRIGESYIDIVARAINTYIFELKRNRLSNKSMAQLQSYLEKSPGRGLLVGSGIASNFEVKNTEIAILIYDEDTLKLTFINKPSWLSSDIVLFPVTSREVTTPNRETMLAPNPNPIRIQSESNPRRGEKEELSTAQQYLFNILLRCPAIKKSDSAKLPELLKDYPGINYELEFKKFVEWWPGPNKRKKPWVVLRNWLGQAQPDETKLTDSGRYKKL